MCQLPLLGRNIHTFCLYNIIVLLYIYKLLIMTNIIASFCDNTPAVFVSSLVDPIAVAYLLNNMVVSVLASLVTPFPIPLIYKVISLATLSLL